MGRWKVLGNKREKGSLAHDREEGEWGGVREYAQRMDKE